MTPAELHQAIANKTRAWIKELCESVTPHLLNREGVSGRTHVDSEWNEGKYIDFILSVATHQRKKPRALIGKTTVE